ncbi:MAG: cell division protein FtsQ/DivIB [Christensenellales bacterium]
MKKIFNMSKPLAITLICVALFVIIMLVLLNCVFVVRSAKVNLLKTSSNVTNESLLNVAKNKNAIPYGQSVFFYNRVNVTSNIEKAVPNIKVINLEIEFPNIISINCVERIPVFAVNIKNSTYNYAIIDEEFKVIDNVMSNTNYINLNFVDVGQSDDYLFFNNLQKGDFVVESRVQDVISFFKVMKEYSLSESALLTLFESVDVYYRQADGQENLCLLFKTKTNESKYTIDIRNILESTDKKIQRMINILSNSEISNNQIIS